MGTPPRAVLVVPQRGLLLLLLGLVVVRLVSSAASAAAITTTTLPQLNGEHFWITAVQEAGFLDISTIDDSAAKDSNGNSSIHSNKAFQFTGYLVDMLAAVSVPERANFTYTLMPPSGYGSACTPRLTFSDNATDAVEPYDARYWTQYNCGADDVVDASIQNDDDDGQHQRTDMYLGMFYVTPQRQLRNQFTVPFLPPTSGTLTMFGTATHIADFADLARQQQQQQQQLAACGPAGTALLSFVETAYPGLRLRGIFGGEDEIYEAFRSGECHVYIVDGPIAAQTVLRYSQREGRCRVNGQVCLKFFHWLMM
jgi:ABC-type amino acid transport substrate-binding protein